MKIACIWEHNGSDSLLYARDYPGAYSRGNDLDTAKSKIAGEMAAYFAWLGRPLESAVQAEIVLDAPSRLNIADADSDVLLPGEELALSQEAYHHWKSLALKSAEDFHRLYLSIPEKDRPIAPNRPTFYGHVPVTANEMYCHTKNVNAYYFGEIGVDADNDGTIFDCRCRGFSALESIPGFLEAAASEGSYGEIWSLKKVLRRFLWHDRIHAKAMYRRSAAVFGKEQIPDLFHFSEMP